MPMEKFARIQKAGALLFDQLADFVGSSPYQPGGPDHHVLTGADAGLDISQDGLRGGEIDHGIDIAQFLRR